MARRRGGVKGDEVKDAGNGQEPTVNGSRSQVREMPTGERPRERLLRYGAQALSDAELVAVLLNNGSRGASVLDLSRDLLNETGGLMGLIEAEDQLMRCPGIGRVKAAAVLAAREMACRMTRAKIARRKLLDYPEAVASYLTLRFSVADQEVLGALYLDVRNRLITDREIFRGTLSRAAVEPRQILKEALLRNASSFLIFHTHPSGDPSPSAEDLAFTRRMADAGELLGVRMVDHLILGSGGRWVSLRRRRAW